MFRILEFSLKSKSWVPIRGSQIRHGVDKIAECEPGGRNR